MMPICQLSVSSYFTGRVLNGTFGLVKLSLKISDKCNYLLSRNKSIHITIHSLLSKWNETFQQIAFVFVICL